MGAVPPRPPAASHRSVRLTVLALLVLAVWLSTTSTQHREAGEQRRRAAELGEQQVAAASAASRLESAAVVAGAGSGARPLFGLLQPQLEAAVVAGSERHGPVTKAGPLPQEFWTDARRPWRERVFMNMLKRGASAGSAAACWLLLLLACRGAWCSHGAACAVLMQPCHAAHALPSSGVPAILPPGPTVRADMAQPRSSEYWAADPATGELALRPLALPYPLCHTCVCALLAGPQRAAAMCGGCKHLPIGWPDSLLAPPAKTASAGM